jgi:hypothetical protein
VGLRKRAFGARISLRVVNERMMANSLTHSKPGDSELEVGPKSLRTGPQAASRLAFKRPLIAKDAMNGAQF